MKVKLIGYTQGLEKVVAMAGKLCYSPVGIDELEENLTEEKIQTFIKNLVDMGHESPLEHCSFNFAVEGVSRALSHQLVRHRIASYSQQSQRYVKEEEGKFEFIIPNVIKCMGEDAVKEYEDDIRSIHSMYLKWQGNIKRYVEDVDYPTYGMSSTKVANENARYVLPNASETKIIVTMNVRSLYNFFSKRLCHRAQEEIRELAELMLEECRDVCPILFDKIDAPCVYGKCPEGKLSCGVPKSRK